VIDLIDTLVENWSDLIMFQVKNADMAVSKEEGFLTVNDRCTTNTLITEMFNLSGFIFKPFHFF